MDSEAAVLERLESAAATPAPPVEKLTPDPTAAVPAPEATLAEQPSQVEATETEAELDLEAVPESSGDHSKFKAVLDAHPEFKGELRQIIGRERAFSELAPNGSFQELKQIVERIPSLADAEQLVADADSKRTFSQTFREDPMQFAESLKESDPQAFSAFAKQLPQVLAETAPELYSEHARYYVNNAIDFVFSIAQRSGDQELLDAVQKVAARGFGYQLGSSVAQPRAENSEVVKLRKEKQDRERSDAEAEFQNFWQQTDEVITGASVSAIEETLKKALPDATPAQIERMKKESYERLLEAVGAQPQVVAQNKQYREAAMKGKRGIAEHKAIVAFMTGRAKLAIPRVTKAVIDEWSKDVIKRTNETTEKKKVIAANTRDVGKGPQGTTSAGAPANNGNTRRTTDDVFKELEARTYVPR